ncbi:MAG: TlpA family protein disulfide reductase [Gemmatimonadales bacterium]
MADRRTGGQADGRAGGPAGRRTGGQVARCAGVLLGATLLAMPVIGAEAQGGKAVGTVIQPVTVNDLDGNAFDFATVLGKRPVLVQFWATWCSVCEALMPAMRAAHAEFGDRVEFIGVNVTVNQSPARVRRYLEEHKPPFRTLYDTRGAAVRAFEAPATGFVAIVGADGRVAYTGIGERQDLVAALRRVVQ